MSGAPKSRMTVGIGLIDSLRYAGIPPVVTIIILIFVAIELLFLFGFLLHIAKKRCFGSNSNSEDYHPMGPDYFLIETPASPKTKANVQVIPKIHANTEKPPVRTMIGKTHKRTVSDPFEFPLPRSTRVIVAPQQNLMEKFQPSKQPSSKEAGKNETTRPKGVKRKLSTALRGFSMPEQTLLSSQPNLDDLADVAREKRVKFAMSKSQSTPANLFKFGKSTDVGSIDPDLYRFDKSNFLKELPSRYGLGKMAFALTYDEEMEQLHVFVDQAAQLPAKSKEELPDTVIQIVLIPGSGLPSGSTRVVRRNCNPNFRQDFVFRLPSEKIKDIVVKFKVCEFDRFSHVVPIGEVAYPLESHHKLDGGPPIWRDLHPPVKPSPGRCGELLVSLTFLPNAEKLNVVILKGRKLRLLEWQEKSIDTFVKIALVKSGKIVKSKHTGVCRKTSNPTFNEGFSMSVQQTDLDEVCLVVTVSHRLNHFGSSRIIGRCVIGQSAGADGASHWRDMINSPRSGVAQWHCLR